MRVVLLVAALALAGCQMTMPHPFAGKSPEPAVEKTAITGGEIETTSLDAAPAPLPTLPEAAKMIGAEAPEALEELPQQSPAAEQPKAQVAAKSLMQVDCEKKGGTWAELMQSGAFCQKPTRDGGKQCKVSGDCEGACLARSRTCAPVTPLLGCQEVMDSDGRVQQQCIN